MSTYTAMVMTAQGAAPEPEQRPVPDPGAGEVLVKVNASSVNYHDMVNLAGLIWGEWPRVPMSDGAGEVVAIGPDVTDFSVGDRVMSAFHPGWHDGPPTPQAKAELPGDSGDGWLQQYRIAASDGLVATPPHLSDIEAATLPCAGVTAWNALLEAGIGPGDVVVTQGTGGVSLFAVQFAHALGADVIVTSSSDEKLKIGSALGAAHLINYRDTPDWENEVKRITGGRGADLVVDLGGPETLAHSVRAARMGGTVAVIGVLTGFDAAPVPVAELMLNNIRVIGITVGSVLSFVELCELITTAGIKPHISHVFDWTEVGDAVRVLQAGEHVGKIALRIS
ncbi:NAD(P)-dependent alcohol dehydrogenase [Mycobacterium sp. ENV421]|uniref:zinc-dependent alcohol dehydrogenase family protein n=1 Tax=Mycobacterium sp. ENV421 TaxID=1213407 RepID=UPI000C9BFEF7|nr:NAD(P)-dependent alcohol dehydrogenase [Mycobacterium sp. ENV421]PND57321.1 NAD(P)-dependent alcohol dehydrogenase [Mycobacterium sp. ENV421]